jgi:hypothetical protein
MEIPTNAQDKILDFKKKDKFKAEPDLQYPGASTIELKQKMDDRINAAADEFLFEIRGNASEKSLQLAIGRGLNKFKDIYLEMDTEDQERVCIYFEELMDIVGLESSAGQLNMFRYGFDPTK